MINFHYARGNDVADAVHLIGRKSRTAKFIAGGTNLIDLMKMDVERPTTVIDITGCRSSKVEATLPGGGLRIGALVRNTDLAYHPLVEQLIRCSPMRIMAGASQQLRNMASTGGNLLATDPLSSTSTTSRRLQQTRTRQRLLRHRRPQSHECDPGHERHLHRGPSVRHVRGAGDIRGEGPRWQRLGRSRDRVR